MNFLRGIFVPPPSPNVKAKLQFVSQEKSYRERYYYATFYLNETITLRSLKHKKCADSNDPVTIDLYSGQIKLNYENHKFFQNSYLFGFYKNGPEKDKIFSYSCRRNLWREGISKLSEKLWNEEVEKFRQAFLNDDPIVHKQIHATILKSMNISFCERCCEQTNPQELRSGIFTQDGLRLSQEGAILQFMREPSRNPH
jgi:hypothetical protein